MTEHRSMLSANRFALLGACLASALQPAAQAQSAAAGPDLEFHGSVHQMMHEGDSSSAITLSPEVLTSKTTGLGALAGHAGTLSILDGELRLVFGGDDPGIAMDLRRDAIPAGPYRLTFRLRGGSVDGGELFFTTDPKTTLPRGIRIDFDVTADGNWQEVEVELPTSESIQQLRLDVSTGAGKATIGDLRLRDAAGKVLMRWPS